MERLTDVKLLPAQELDRGPAHPGAIPCEPCDRSGIDDDWLTVDRVVDDEANRVGVHIQAVRDAARDLCVIKPAGSLRRSNPLRHWRTRVRSRAKPIANSPMTSRP